MRKTNTNNHNLEENNLNFLSTIYNWFTASRFRKTLYPTLSVLMLITMFVPVKEVRGAVSYGASATSNASSTNTIVCTLPTHSEDDVLIIFAYTSRLTATILTPSGWTAVFDTVTVTGGADNGALRAFAKIAGASETNPTVTADTGGLGWLWCEATAVTGTVTDDLADLTSGASGTKNPCNGETYADFVSATVDVADSIALRFAAQSDDNVTGSGTADPPSGHTKIVNAEDPYGRSTVAYAYATAQPSSISATTWVNAMPLTCAIDETEISATVVIPPLGFEVSGNFYQTDEVTGDPGQCNGSTENLSIRVNGGTATTADCDTSTGAFTFSGVNASAGDTITIYSTGVDKGNTVYVSDGTADTGIALYEDRVAIRDDQDGTVTIPDLWDYDSTTDDTNMLFNAVDDTTDTLTTESGIELHIHTGDKFDPGGTVTTTGSGNLHITQNAEVEIDNASSVIGGDVLITGGGTNTIFDVQANVSISGGAITTSSTNTTVTYTGTPTVTISGTGSIGGGTTPSLSFYNLSTSGTGTTTLSNSSTINNTLTVGSGTTLNVNADVSIANNFTNTTTGIINTTSGTPTVTLTGSATIGGGSGAITLHHLTTSGTGSSFFSGSGTNTFDGNITVGSGTTLNIDSSISVDGNFTNTTTGVIGNSTGTPTVTMTDNTSSSIGGGSGAITFYHLATTGTGIHTLTGSGTNTISNNVTVGSGTTLNINNNLSVGGALTNTTTGVIGTSAGTPTITLTGTGTLGSGSGNITFHHLTTSGTGTYNFSGSGTNTVNGNVTVGSGTTLNINSSTSVTGNLVNTTTGIIGYSGTPTLTMTGTSNSIGGGSGAISFYNLIVNPSSAGTITANSDATVNGALTISASDKLTIASSKSITVASTGSLTLTNEIDGAGTLIYQPSAAFPTSGTMTVSVQFDATSASQIVSNRTYVGNVELYNNSGASRTYTLGTAGSQTLNFSSNLTLNGNSGTPTLNADTHNPTVNVTGNISYTAGGSSESIASGAGVWTVTGDVNFTNGTFTASANNTFKMNGSGKTLTSNSTTLNDFEVSGGSISSGDGTDINGAFTVSGGSFAQEADSDLNVAGNFSLSNGVTFTKASGAGIVRLDGDLDYADNTSPQQDIGEVFIGASPDTTILTTDMTASGLTITASDFYYTCEYDLNIGDSGITVAGTLDTSASGSGNCGGDEGDETIMQTDGKFDLQSGATFDQDASTLEFTGGAGTDDLITNGSFSLYNLTVNGSNSALIVEVEDALDVDNNVTITVGTLDAHTTEFNQINVGGNWDNDDTFQARSALVYFDAQSGTKTIDANGTGTDSFYDIQFNDGVGTATFQLTDTMNVNNNFTNTEGTVDANGQQINVGNNWSNSGAFTSNSNLVVMDGQDAGNTLTGTMTGSSSFYNLTFDDSVSSGAWTFSSNDATITNNFIITGGTVTAPSTTLTIGGNFTNNDAFTHNSGTVVFDNSGKTSTLTYAATTTFNNFTVATGGKQMEFDNSDGVITDIDGALSLQGSGCGAGRILLDPDVAEQVWDIAASGSVDIDYVDVEYSTASPALTANNSTENNDNNTGWTVNEGLCTAFEAQFLDGVILRDGAMLF